MLTLLSTLGPSKAAAQHLFKCETSDGQVVFSQTECGEEQTDVWVDPIPKAGILRHGQTHDDDYPDPGEELPRSGGGGSGTCFFIDEFGTAVTNDHVVQGSRSVQVVDAIGRTSPATISVSSAGLDIAVLKTELRTPSYMTFAPRGLAIMGDEVFTIGFPAPGFLGENAKFSEGVISSSSGIDDDRRYIQMSTPIQPGNSGGPLVNTSGQVVGVVTASAAIEPFLEYTGTLPQNVNWAIKSDDAVTIIEEARFGYGLPSRDRAIAHTRNSVCRVLTK